MRACSIQNKDTKEPILFHKSDRGDIHPTVHDVLNNTDSSFETGFLKEDGSFITVSQTPIFDKNTQEGRIQNYVKNGFLNEQQVEPNIYESPDNFAADILEKEELVLNHFGTYRRKGLQFEFGNFKPVIEKSYSDSAKTKVRAADIYTQMASRIIEKPVSYTEDQLLKLMTSFMNKMGFSIENIENYKKNYKIKFGVEPNAEALIDFHNKIIAFTDGKITLDSMSEEFSHFVIEMWNQEEIERMLQSVNNTQEYIEHSQKYREIYAKQISDKAELERAVRKEVLGKMLSNSLQSQFSLDGRSETEVGFFNKLAQILRDFFNFFKSKMTNRLKNDIENMSKDIKNRLYNETLHERLGDNTPTINVMYSIGQATIRKVKDATKDLRFDRLYDNTDREVVEFISSALSTSIAYTDQLNDLSDNEVTPVDLTANIEILLGCEDLLAMVTSQVRKSEIKKLSNSKEDIALYNSMQAAKKTIVSKGEEALKQLNILKGDYKNRKQVKDVNAVAEELLDKYPHNLSEDAKDKFLNDVKSGVTAIQRDTKGWFARFGNTGKATNRFVTLLSQIINSLQAVYTNSFMQDMLKRIDPLEKHKDILKDFIDKKGYFRSSINNYERDRLKKQYELDILKIVDPDKYGETELEDYMNEHLESPVKFEDEDLHFHYKYLYDLGLQDQKWVSAKAKDRNKEYVEKLERMDLGLRPWEHVWYKQQVRLSKARSEGSSISIEQRREDSNPFSSSGALKKGFKAMYYSEALDGVRNGEINGENVVSTNPRFTMFKGETTDPKSKDIVFLFDPSLNANDIDNQQGLLAYHYMKWNTMNLAEQSEETVARVKENFANEYYSQLDILRNKYPNDEISVEKELRKWLKDSLFFEPTKEYWDNTNFEEIGINFNGFLNNPTVYGKDKQEMKTIEKEYKILSIRKQLILKKYKLPNDYKEINADNISPLDKESIYSIEGELGELRKKVFTLFENNNLDTVYLDTGNKATLKLNTAFHESFKNATGVEFEDASIENIETFFQTKDNFNTSKYNEQYAGLKRDLRNKNTKSKLIEIYKDHANDLGLSTSDDDIKKAFFIMNSPSWFKRYDANTEYDSFIRDYNSGKIKTVDLIEDYILSNTDEVIYNGSPLKLMKITPSFKYSTEQGPNIQQLVTEYWSATSNIAKYNILERMNDIENVDESLRESMSDITGNAERLEAYILMMDAHLTGLEKEETLQQRYLYLMPQVRHSDYERVERFVKDSGKLALVKEWWKDMTTFTPDDMEDSYKNPNENLKIPKYGYYRLKPEELTEDVFFALVWRLNNANLYKSRKDHWRDGVSAMQGLEAQEFQKGVKSTDTNYHKMMREMIDYNFYGKTITTRMEFEIALPGGGSKTIDFSKFIYGFKNLSIGFALGLSPIVALTNLSSGIIQNALISSTGRHIYSPSNKRAFFVMSKLFPESVKDVGAFNPESKLNKIMYQFGIYNLNERYKNSKYSKLMRLLPQSLFSMMAITNFPMEAQSLLVKLMEHRLVDGKFVTWRQYSMEQKTKNPSLKTSEIKANFENYKELSMYDFLNDDGSFDEDKLTKEGYTGDILKDKAGAMIAARSIAEQTTMEIASHHEGYGGRDPLWSFVLSLKKWLVMATSTMFSGRRVDLETGGEEEGLIFSPKYMMEMFKSVIKDKKTMMEAYDTLDELGQKNLKTTVILSGIITVMFTLALLLKKAADDDDEEDNYLLQLSAYLALRSLNEVSSSTIGIGQSYFESVQNPIMMASTIKNMPNVFKVGDIGTEIEQGKYKGVDKYVAGLMKATWLKNPYTVSSGRVLNETRHSYEFFNKKESLYHIFDLIPEKPKDEE